MAKAPATTVDTLCRCLTIPPDDDAFSGTRVCRIWSWLRARKNAGEDLRGYQLPVFALCDRLKFHQSRCVASGQSRAFAFNSVPPARTAQRVEFVFVSATAHSPGGS